MEKIKIFVTDLDGTLTDGMYHVSDSGSITKSFYTRDFSALQKLQDRGILVLILTAAEDGVLEKKISQLPYACVQKLLTREGVHHKDVVLSNDILAGRRLSWSQVAYIGDASNDALCMEQSGYSGCPSDAEDRVKELSNYISDKPGGRGAVEQFVNWLISQDLV